jgi:molecular chaperone GrpE
MTDQHEDLQPLEAAATGEGSGEPGGGAPARDEAPTDPDGIRRERDEFQDLLLRKIAEFDNYRKRTERERRDFNERAAADLIAELLPLVDNLERALAAETGEPGADAYRTGVELIHKQLLDVLARRGVTPIDPLGAPFDPHLHEAVAREHGSDRPEGEVVAVFSRGYALGDRLLRPAMVKVATA